MQVTSRSEKGITVDVEFSDAGINATAVAPVVSGLTQSPVYYPYGVALTVTTYENKQRVEIDAVATPRGTSTPPSNTATQWRKARIDYVPTAITQTYDIPGLQSGLRYWVRVRTQATDGRLPSAWVSAGYYDAPPLIAPVNLVGSGISPTSIDLQWDNAGDTTSQTLIQLGVPSGAPWDNLIIVPAGSTQHTVYDGTWIPGMSISVTVLHIDPYGGISAPSNILNFTTGGTHRVCPTPFALRVSPVYMGT